MNTRRELFEQIRALGTALESFEREASRKLGINRSDLQALNALEHGPLSHGDVAGALGITTGSVTALVDRLVDAGYVQRRPSTRDRRRVEVELTPRTYAALADVYRPCGEAVATSLRRMTEADQYAATSALALAADAITRTADQIHA